MYTHRRLLFLLSLYLDSTVRNIRELMDLSNYLETACRCLTLTSGLSFITTRDFRIISALDRIPWIDPLLATKIKKRSRTHATYGFHSHFICILSR